MKDPGLTNPKSREHSVPDKQKHSGISTKTIALVLLLFLGSFNKEEATAQIPRVIVSTPSEVKKDASRRTARIQYQLAREKTKETGIFLSADSAALISPGQATRYRQAGYNEASQVFQVDFEGLEPDSGYFYKIFIKDQQNKISWSAITAIHTPGFNINWPGNQKKTTRRNAAGDLMLIGESVDTVRSHYRVLYNGIPGKLIRITSTPESVKSYYIIRLPLAPPGVHKLMLLYKQKKIFEEQVEVL